VLVNGAAGGVRHFAVPIARAMDAIPTGVCGPANVDFVRSLGVENVVDYTQDEFTRRTKRCDVVFDVVANRSFGACRHLLMPGGFYVTTL
jgi:NADPH:quinone reductase-like Zn-dependent oxidoreductase